MGSIGTNSSRPHLEVGAVITNPQYTATAIAQAMKGEKTSFPDFGCNLLVVERHADGRLGVVEMNKRSGKVKGDDESGNGSMEAKRGITQLEIKQEWLKDVSRLKEH